MPKTTQQRRMAKARRRQHRMTVRAGQETKAQTKRTAKFRAEGLRRIAEASQMLLRGAEAAGIDMTPADIKTGKVRADGMGELTIDKRVPPEDVKRAYAKAAELEKAEAKARAKAAESIAADPVTATPTMTAVVPTGTDGNPRWGAQLNGEWLTTANGRRRSWTSPEAAEQALQRASLIASE